MNTNIFQKASIEIKKIGFGLKKRSPEIAIVAGTVGIVGTIVLACRATLKVEKILNESKETLEKIEEMASRDISNESNVEYSEDDKRKDTVLVYVQTGLKVAKEFAPAVILGTTSIMSIFASHYILKKRNAVLVTTYAALHSNFKEYASRVAERFGEEVEKEIRYNIVEKKITETEIDPKTGKEKKVEKTVKVMDGDESRYSQYAKFFDEGSKYWEKDPNYNLLFLRRVQNFANDRLKAQGFLFLNDVYDDLDIPRTKIGQMVGWIYDPENPIGDNFVDFGIYNINKTANRDFINGYNNVLLLDFNVDGYILDRAQFGYK